MLGVLLSTLFFGGMVDDKSKEIKKPVDVPGKSAPAPAAKPADKSMSTAGRRFKLRSGDSVRSSDDGVRSGSGRFLGRRSESGGESSRKLLRGGKHGHRGGRSGGGRGAGILSRFRG